MKLLKILFIIFLIAVINDIEVYSKERVHFITINEWGTDAIILESNGKFAMIDVGEDLDYPKGDIEKYPLTDKITTNPNYSIEERLFYYIEKLGIKELEFIILTHSHSDHIGNIDEILRKIPTKKIFLKKYDDYRIYNKDRLYDNQYVYDKAIEATKQFNIELIQDISDELSYIKLENINIKLYNYENEYDENGALLPVWDENVNSILSLLTYRNDKFFLGGDLDNVGGKEDKYGDIIGEVDIMKFNHHIDVSLSNTKSFIKKLNPKYMIKTWNADVDPPYKSWLDENNIGVINADRKDIPAIVFEMTGNGIKNVTEEEFGNRLLYIKNKTYLKSWDDKIIETEGFINTQNAIYYINSSGEVHKGFLYLNGSTYYFYNNGKMARNRTINENGTYYSFNEEGKLL